MAIDSLPKTVLVTGASGALGPAVVKWLVARGYRVRGLALTEPAEPLGSLDVDWFIGDICDRALLQSAMEGMSHVVHMAALLHINNPSPQMCAEYERVNVGGTQAVVEAALRSGTERLVFLSTIAVYGYGRGEMLFESSTPVPRSYYAETKLAAEQIVLAARRSDGTPLGAVLRLAAVYGSRVKGNYSRLVEALNRGRFVPVGSGDNRRTLVYEKDVAAAIALTAKAPAAAGQIYNVTDGDVHTLSEIIEAICGGLGRRPPRAALPAAPIRGALRRVDAAANLLGWQLPVSSAMLDKYLEDVAVDGSKIVCDLGYHPAYDLRSGWQDAIDGMRLIGGTTGAA